jgi:hypothetical protein
VWLSGLLGGKSPHIKRSYSLKNVEPYHEECESIPHRENRRIMMTPPRPGCLDAIDGIEAARQGEGIRDVFIMSKPGDVMLALPEKGCYAGFISATGAAQSEVIDRLKELHGKLTFGIAPI